MFMSSAQAGACKPRVNRASRVQCRDCGERHVLVGEERYQGPGMGNAWGEGREGRGLSDAEGWKVSEVWGDYGRLSVMLGDGMGLLPPPLFSL